MNYHLFAEEIGVDAGMILIADEDYYGIDHEPIGRKFQKIFNVAPGYYHLTWKIENTFDGDVEGDGTVYITSGKLVVSDPCYIIKEENWMKTLEDTKYFENEPEGTVVLDKMGGDGLYDVEIILERMG